MSVGRGEDPSPIGHPGGRTAGSRVLPGRVLVVSHACVVPENQSVYGELADWKWEVDLVVPGTWKHEYAERAFKPRASPRLAGRVIASPVMLAGRPQRHLYLRRPGRVLDALRPQVVFLEEECFAVSAFQWALAAERRGIPFGVQADENLDRPLPWVARALRSWVLPRASFVAARSPAAQELVRQWGAKGAVELIPHAVPLWRVPPPSEHIKFCVGYAGRLVPEKGIGDLVDAVRLLDGRVQLLLAGDGALRDELCALQLPNAEVSVLTGLSHGEIVEAYRSMDVLVLPSRTTPNWAEQFGRVLVEALWCGVPVIGSDSGAIPWLIAATGGGMTFPEGDSSALAQRIDALREDPQLRSRLAAAGREAVVCQFSARAVAADLHATLLASCERTSSPSR
jgi:glycosyltransferase involved in cell wall biosynthesis